MFVSICWEMTTVWCQWLLVRPMHEHCRYKFHLFLVVGWPWLVPCAWGLEPAFLVASSAALLFSHLFFGTSIPPPMTMLVGNAIRVAVTNRRTAWLALPGAWDAIASARAATRFAIHSEPCSLLWSNSVLRIMFLTNSIV